MKIFYYIYILFFIPTFSFSQNPCLNVPTVDYEGKTYNTVQIGSQCWLKENLDVGTMIDSLTNPGNNGIIEKYCYGNNPANCTTYGGLYQWNEAMQYVTTSGTQGICPTGWHIPTYAELQTLATWVGNDANSLLAVGQGGGTNTIGFSALLAGYRYYNGKLFSLGLYTFFWSSTESYASGAYSMSLGYNGGGINFGSGIQLYGFSVRCAKDASTSINDHSNNTLPNSIHLFQNFPNPFNPSTTIKFSLPKATHVNLSIYNSMGQEISKLISKAMSAGVYTPEWNASGFASGVYYYRIVAGDFIQTKKLILLK
jgi:uncharacterized protein (TIGR02145 family)